MSTVVLAQANAVEVNQSSTSQADSGITTPSPIKFAFKGYLKFEENSFDQKNETIREQTLRLDPAWTYEKVQFGFRQEVKGIMGDAQSLENTRLFIGPTAFPVGSAVSVQPLMRYYVPTKMADRDKGLNGVMEPAVRTSFTFGKLKAVYDLGLRQYSFRRVNGVNRDDNTLYKIKHEVEGTYPIYQKFNLRMKVELEDGWNHASRWGQDFHWEQGVGYQVSEHFNWEFGHQVTLKTAEASGKRRSLKVFDDEGSELFTRLNLVY